MDLQNIASSYPVSPNQHRILDALSQGSKSQFSAGRLSLHLQGEPDVAALEAALGEAIRNHDILRTFFVWQGMSQPRQVLCKTLKVSLKVQTGSLGDSGDLIEVLEDDRKKNLDLNKLPLFRSVLYRLTPESSVLNFVYHPILLDHWNAVKLMRQVLRSYEFTMAGRQPETHHNKSFKSYIQTIDDTEDKQDPEAWARQLDPHDGTYSPAALKFGKKDQRGRDYPWAKMQVPDLQAGFWRQTCREMGITLEAAALGAWAVLWRHYSSDAPALFQVRTTVPDCTILGPTSTPAPFSSAVDPGQTGGAFLQALHHRFEKMRASWSHAPSAIEQWLSAHNAQQISSIQMLFNHEDETSLIGSHFGNLSVEGCTSGNGNKLPFCLGFTARPSEITLSVNLGAPALLLPGPKEILAHFQSLIHGLLDRAKQPIFQLSPLTKTEHLRLKSHFNQTKHQWPTPHNVAEAFQKQAENNPEQVAFCYGSDLDEQFQLTYRELNERSNQLANYLVSLGVGPEIKVGCLLDRSLELVVAMAAIIKAGGVYLPLDPNLPYDRLAFVLEDAQAPVLILSENLESKLPSVWAQLVFIDSDWETISACGASPPETHPLPQNLAYMIYTSGSSGTPKGTVLDYAALANLCHWYCEAFAIGVGTRVMQSFSIGFDASVKNLFAMLTRGGTGVLLAAGPYDIEEMLATLENRQVDLLNIVPSMLYPVIDLAEQNQFKALVSLKNIAFGGEEANLSRLANWLASENCQCRINNIYGPTEAADSSIYYRSKPDAPLPLRLPMGNPASNFQVYLVDLDLNLVPERVAGHLAISGTGLARGYHGKPAQTAQVFVPHPFLKGERLYLSGDKARRNEQGDLEFLGRLDHQVKMRGFRIELGEIETVLAKHPDVAEAAVLVAGNDTEAEPYLAAYVAVMPGGLLSVEPRDQNAGTVEFKQFLKEKLPDYMIPTAFVFMDSLPTTPSGKLNRKALPAIRETEKDTPSDPPKTETEKTIAKIWESLLGLDAIGVYDSFFDRGGHSLLATQMLSQVRQKFQLDFSLQQFFDGPTIAQMAEHAEGLEKTAVPEEPPITALGNSDPSPLSFAQQRLWLVDQLAGESSAYHLTYLMGATGPFNKEAFAGAIKQIVNRHEVLRTAFTLKGDQPVQVVQPGGQYPVEFTSLTHKPASERRAAAMDQMKDLVQRPFDLGSGNLLRTHVFHLDSQEHLIFFAMHHIVCDGWSLGILISELTTLYQSLNNGESVDLPPLPVQYRDFAQWQRQWLQDGVFQKQLAYWRDQLQDCRLVQKLPGHHQRPQQVSAEAGQQLFTFPESLTQDLHGLCQKQGVTLFMVLLAAYKALIHSHTGDEDLVIGTDVANRNQEALKSLIGFFVNQLVLRTDLSNNPTLSEILQRVQTVTLAAYANQDMPFDQLVDAVVGERDPGLNPFFQTKLVFLNVPQTRLKVAELELTPLEQEVRTAKVDLQINMEETEGQLGGLAIYRQDLFEPKLVARLLRHLEFILALLCTHSDTPLKDLKNLLEEEDRRHRRAQLAQRAKTGAGTFGKPRFSHHGL